ncbi:MAG: SGNH/GDSL hydrolase family protein [Deltaproteobacteria bacterium]|nr:SGNH/GDSL hydrolase family protein [Deltaproteobacteria bacterium]
MRRKLKALAFGFFAAILLVLGGSALTIVAESRYLAQEARQSRAGRFINPDSVHLVFVGDSYTAGELAESGVGYWSYLPRALARQGYPRPVETVSLAQAGSTTAFQRRQLQAFVDESRQRIDLIYLITGRNNDLSWEYQHAYAMSPEAETQIPRRARIWHRAPRPLVALTGVWSRYIASYDGKSFSSKYDADALPSGPLALSQYAGYRGFLIDATLGDLRGIQDIASRNRAVPAFGLYHDVDDMQDIIAFFAEVNGIRVFSIAKAEPGRFTRGAPFVFSPDGWHFSDFGHRLYAQSLAVWLLENRLLPEA